MLSKASNKLDSMDTSLENKSMFSREYQITALGADLLSQAKKAMEADRDNKGFFSGIGDAATDRNFYTAGISDLQLAGYLLGLSQKFNEETGELKQGESLSSAEESLLETAFGYDYVHKELVVSNDRYGYSYVYGIEVGVWYKLVGSYSQFVNHYPKTLGVSATGLVDLGVETTDAVSVLLQTRAVKLGTEGYKSLLRVILRGLFDVTVGKWGGFYVFGSYDAKVWGYLGGVQNKNAYRDMVVKTLRTDCKYFKFVFAGDVGVDSYVSYLEFDGAYELRGRVR